VPGAFGRTAAELADLLATLSPDDWRQAGGRSPGSLVRDVVVHLIGVERYVLGQLGRRAPLLAPRREDHRLSLDQGARDAAAASEAELVRIWWSEAIEVLRVCTALGPEHPVTYHDLPGDVRALVLVRVFELWIHADDIRGALGRPLGELDDPRLSLMSGLLLEMLPIGMALAGTARPGRTARIVLTGPGSGRRDVALAPGQPAGEPDITVVFDTRQLCRLAGNRVPIGELDAGVRGDRSLLIPVLKGASAFAMD
jgi:uncharacterized protein (TIGR03083 family)